MLKILLVTSLVYIAVSCGATSEVTNLSELKEVEAEPTPPKTKSYPQIEMSEYTVVSTQPFFGNQAPLFGRTLVSLTADLSKLTVTILGGSHRLAFKLPREVQFLKGKPNVTQEKCVRRITLDAGKTKVKIDDYNNNSLECKKVVGDSNWLTNQMTVTSMSTVNEVVKAEKISMRGSFYKKVPWVMGIKNAQFVDANGKTVVELDRKDVVPHGGAFTMTAGTIKTKVLCQAALDFKCFLDFAANNYRLMDVEIVSHGYESDKYTVIVDYVEPGDGPLVPKSAVFGNLNLIAK